MSQSIAAFERTGVAGESLTAAKYFIVQLDSSGDIEIGEGATDILVGVLQNAPASGGAAVYRFVGTSKVVCGGVVTLGDKVTSKSDGKALTTTTDKDIVIGIALETSTAEDDIIEIQLGRHMVSNT